MAHILIADDDDIISELACSTLIDQGHACGWVSNGEEALKLLKWRRPDLLLLDQEMPGMSGSQLLRELRNSSEYYDLPIIMFTAVVGREDEIQARFNGAQDYIRKPFDPDKLAVTVDEVLAARAARPRHRDLKVHLEQASGTWLSDEERRRSLA